MSDATFAGAFATALDAMETMNAGVMRMSLGDIDGNPLAVIVVVRGKENSTELVAAMERLEKRWDKKGSKP